MDRHTESDFFYALRGIAIISVAYAHSLSLSIEILQRIGASVGIIGVPLFLVCSGYYFKHEQWNILAKKLAKGIISPWLIWGSLGFFISAFLGAISTDVLSFIAFLSGHGTWLYYIPVYIIVRCVFNWQSSMIFLIGSIGLSIVSNILSFTPPSQLAVINDFCTPWQNPLNWMGFFALGIIIRKFGLIDKIKSQSQKIFLGTLSLIALVLLIALPMKINYWNPIGVVLEYLITFTLIGMVSLSKSKILRVLGWNSLLIYLLHIQIGIASANIIFRLIKLPEIALLIAKPFTVLVITMLLISIIRRIIILTDLNDYSQYLGLFSTTSK